MKRSLALFRLSLLLALVICLPPAFAQTNSGELHLKVTDPSGLPVKTSVQIASQANQYQKTLLTDDQGALVVQRLPFGVYLIKVQQSGFADYTESIQISSGLPVDHSVKLVLSSVSTTVTVTADSTLIDPDQAGAVSQIGTETIQKRLDSLPGRSLQDLVNSQPGWLYEGNAVLHPRGSEYQTQFVVDGIPLQDNRSPSFGPALEADDVQSMSIYTAGFPAEYGRKMGGVIEVNTVPDTRQGFHGQAILSGGSFDTAGAFVQGTYGWGNNAFSASATTDMTNHYLNPVVVAELQQYRHYRRLLSRILPPIYAKRSLELVRPARTFALRHPERANTAVSGPAADGRQLRNDGNRLLPAQLFSPRRTELSRHGAG